MTKSVILYRGPKGLGDTPAEQQKLAHAWGTWYQLLGPGIVDGGHPFGVSSTIAPGRVITNVAASELTGYVIIEATCWRHAMGLIGFGDAGDTGVALSGEVIAGGEG